MKAEFAMMAKEVRMLEKCENIIRKGMGTFVEVGKALMEIRDGRLFRDTHETFQDYCKGKWGFDRQRAYQLIKASEVVENVKHCFTNSEQMPENPRVAAELGRLEAERQAEAWEEVIDRTDGNPTAAAVAEVVDEYLGAEEEEESTPEPSRGFTPADIKDVYKECKALTKGESFSECKSELKELLTMILELWGVTENRAAFQSKMENLISSI